MINVEGFFLSGGQDLKKTDEKVQQNYDLTYFLDAALDYLLKDASECGNDLSASSAEAMNLEQKEGVRNELSLSHSQTARILQEAEPGGGEARGERGSQLPLCPTRPQVGSLQAEE